jgi:hypothetical protein
LRYQRTKIKKNITKTLAINKPNSNLHKNNKSKKIVARIFPATKKLEN